MDKKVLCIAACLVLVCFSMLARAEDDPRLRWANTITKQINHDWSVYLYSEFNTDHDQGHDLNGIDNELGFNYSGMAKWLDLGAAVGHWDEKDSGAWQGNGQTFQYVYSTFKWSGSGVDISNRCRFDFQFPDHRTEDGQVYRNDLVLAPTYKWTRYKIQPFIGDETYYGFLARHLTTNELASGFNFQITKNIGASIFYMNTQSCSKDTDGTKHWKNQPRIGFTTSVAF